MDHNLSGDMADTVTDRQADICRGCRVDRYAALALADSRISGLKIVQLSAGYDGFHLSASICSVVRISVSDGGYRVYLRVSDAGDLVGLGDHRRAAVKNIEIGRAHV